MCVEEGVRVGAMRGGGGWATISSSHEKTGELSRGV